MALASCGSMLAVPLLLLHAPPGSGAASAVGPSSGSRASRGLPALATELVVDEAPLSPHRSRLAATAVMATPATGASPTGTVVSGPSGSTGAPAPPSTPIAPGALPFTRPAATGVPPATATATAPATGATASTASPVEAVSTATTTAPGTEAGQGPGPGFTPAGAAGTVTGEATWYSAAPPDGCASPTLPFGTEVHVVNDASGVSTSCVVDDREASDPGRVLDMSYTGFSQIADPGQGVITVTITW